MSYARKYREHAGQNGSRITRLCGGPKRSRMAQRSVHRRSAMVTEIGGWCAYRTHIGFCKPQKSLAFLFRSIPWSMRGPPRKSVRARDTNPRRSGFQWCDSSATEASDMPSAICGTAEHSAPSGRMVSYERMTCRLRQRGRNPKIFYSDLILQQNIRRSGLLSHIFPHTSRETSWCKAARLACASRPTAAVHVNLQTAQSDLRQGALGDCSIGLISY